jgi:DNA-binding response OmpR family regulator
MIKRTTGIKGEITLCCFVRITPVMIFSESRWPFLLLLAGGLIVAGLSVFVVIRRRKRIPDPAHATESPAEPFQLDTIERALICQDCKIVLSEETFRLFEYIWNKDSHYAPYNDISDYLYGSVDIKTGKSRISQTVKQLRDRLKDRQTVKIENVSGKGYRIILE